MTCIISPKVFESKAKLEAKLNASGGLVWIEDPSVFKPMSGTAAEMIPIGKSLVVTNHPLRTKFAEVRHLPDGSWKVK